MVVEGNSASQMLERTDREKSNRIADDFSLGVRYMQRHGEKTLANTDAPVRPESYTGKGIFQK